MTLPRTKMTSPKGTAVWPWLNEPDTRYDDNGVYTVQLRLDAEEAAAFTAELKEKFKLGYEQQAKEQGKKKLKLAPMPWKDHEDDQGNATGKVDFKFKMKAAYEYEGKKIDNRVLLIDAKRNPVTAQIGSGSSIRCGFEPYVWYVPSMGVGMTLRLKAVQVIDLVEFGKGGGTDDFDFQEEEGFTAVASATPDKERGDHFDF